MKSKKLMTLNEYQELAGRTAIYPNRGNNLSYTVLGLCEEAGEIAGHSKRIIRDDGGVLTDERKAKMVKELGDALWYLSECAINLGITLQEVAEQNIEKLVKRSESGLLHGEGDTRGESDIQMVKISKSEKFWGKGLTQSQMEYAAQKMAKEIFSTFGIPAALVDDEPDYINDDIRLFVGKAWTDFAFDSLYECRVISHIVQSNTTGDLIAIVNTPLPEGCILGEVSIRKGDEVIETYDLRLKSPMELQKTKFLGQSIIIEQNYLDNHSIVVEFEDLDEIKSWGDPSNFEDKAKEYTARFCEDRETLLELADVCKIDSQIFDFHGYDFTFYKAGSLYSAELKGVDSPPFGFTGWLYLNPS